MHRLSIFVAALVACAGCQSPGAATGAGAPAVHGAGPTVVTFYTHEGAEALYHAAKYADAIAMCQEAIAAIEKAGGKKSPQLAEPLIDLATVHMRLAKYAEAKGDIDRAEGVLNAGVKEQALMLGRLGINKGWRVYSLGESETAQKIFHDARVMVEKNKPGDSKDLAELINNEALMIEEAAGEAEDAEGLAQSRRMLLTAWQMRRRLTGDNSPESEESLNNLGMNLLFNPTKVDDITLALNTLKKSLEVSVKVYGEENPETAISHTNLALGYLHTDDLEDAEREIRRALPVTQRFLGDKHPDRAYQLSTLGRIFQEQTHYDEAEKAFMEAVSITEAAYGKNHPNVANELQYLAHLYEVKGDVAKQGDVERRIEKLSSRGI